MSDLLPLGEFEDLRGQQLYSISRVEYWRMDEIIFTLENEERIGERYKLFWDSDGVIPPLKIVHISGNVQDLINIPLLEASETVFFNKIPPGRKLLNPHKTFVWTFFRLKTTRGELEILWYGGSLEKTHAFKTVSFGPVTERRRGWGEPKLKPKVWK